ncbi:MAG: PLP-dependent aminotransferase family protein [Gemmatimonadota bacterium]
MPKRVSTHELVLPENHSGVPQYLWLGDALRRAILDGRLKPGSKLPASRDLARQYKLSRGTIVTAFEQLAAEGYVSGRVGSGTYVSDTLPERLFTSRRKTTGPAKVRPARQREPDVLRVKAFPLSDFLTRVRPFRANVPALQLFPTALWAQTMSRRLRRLTSSQLLGSETAGHRPLREQIAEYLRVARGVRCSYEQVVVVSGAQEALDLVARLLVQRGDAVFAEDPGYVGAWRVFEALGARVLPLAVDHEGATTPDARQAARLAYVTPAHQCPLGVSMSASRRLALLEWAQRAGAFVVEDDYDSEFRYEGRPLPALHSLDATDSVILCGSFSKVLFPSLRLGYLVVPPDLIEPLTALKSVTARHAPLLDQIALADFMADGHFARHIRRMREVYAERLATLIDSARQRLQGLLDISSVAAGLQTVGWLAPSIDADAAIAAATTRDVVVMPVRERGQRTMPNNALVLGFAAFDPQDIRAGVRNLASALEAVQRKGRPQKGAVRNQS